MFDFVAILFVRYIIEPLKGWAFCQTKDAGGGAFISAHRSVKRLMFSGPNIL